MPGGKGRLKPEGWQAKPGGGRCLASFSHGIYESAPCSCAQADWETATGAVNMMLIHQLIGNAYRNVSNIVVSVRPRMAPPGAKALLLNAHYDNTLGSPGKRLGLWLIRRCEHGSAYCISRQHQLLAAAAAAAAAATASHDQKGPWRCS